MKDNNTKINLNNKDKYFIIEGCLNNCHKTRIILQDLEKIFYKNYLN